ncbi:MAG: hypothetical protein K2X90_00755 [Candidatus Babeliaceae bacterium]|nr:hypothetical protein [Candidatus Babeliaceae bacterium]
MKISIKKALFFTFFGILCQTQTVYGIIQPKAIIFVFSDVLESNRTSMVSEIGLWNSLFNLTTALKSQTTMFKALEALYGPQTDSIKAYDPQPPHDELPVPFVNWLLGKNSAQVCNEIKKSLQAYKFPGGSSEKKFIFGVFDIIFDPARMAGTFGVKSDSLKLIEKISNGPIHPRLILVANCNNQMFDNLRTMNPGSRVLRHFNDTYVSGHNKMLVEDPRLYQKIIEDHAFQASEYVIISSNKHAIQAAKSVGMHTIYSPDSIYSAGKDYCKSVHLIKR